MARRSGNGVEEPQRLTQAEGDAFEGEVVVPQDIGGLEVGIGNAPATGEEAREAIAVALVPADPQAIDVELDRIALPPERLVE